MSQRWCCTACHAVLCRTMRACAALLCAAQARVDVRVEMFTGEAAEALLLRGADGREERPDYVLDAIDNIDTKASPAGACTWCHGRT